MKLTPPTKTAFWLAALLGLLGIILHLGIVTIPILSDLSFWLVVLGWLLLMLGSVFRGV